MISKADGQFAGGDFSCAVQSYNEARKSIELILPQAKQRLLAKAQSNADVKHANDALATLGELLALDAANPQAQALKQKIIDMSRQAKIADLLARAKSNANPEHANDALATLKELLALDAANRDALALQQQIMDMLRQTKIAGLLSKAKSNANLEHANDALATLSELLAVDSANLEAQALQRGIIDMLRQAKIAELLAKARANDSEEKGHDALATLAELLKVDPGNAEASALRNKISAYYTHRTITNSIGMTLVEVKPGEFRMGSPADETGRDADEAQHKVKITKVFMLGVSHVTRGQFAAFVKASGYQTEAERAGDAATWKNRPEQRSDDYPVVCVSWNDAQAFCQWLGRKEGKTYGLPTEAQWEYACRAGTTMPYNSSGAEAAMDEAAWYDANSEHKTHPIDQKNANAWGLYDMHGKAWEWCNDYYGPYPTGDGLDPTGPAEGNASSSRVLRGGSCVNIARDCRAASRGWGAASDRSGVVGFRCLMELP